MAESIVTFACTSRAGSVSGFVLAGRNTWLAATTTSAQASIVLSRATYSPPLLRLSVRALLPAGSVVLDAVEGGLKNRALPCFVVVPIANVAILRLAESKV